MIIFYKGWKQCVFYKFSLVVFLLILLKFYWTNDFFFSYNVKTYVDLGLYKADAILGQEDQCGPWSPEFLDRKIKFLKKYGGYNAHIEDIALKNLERFENQVYLDYGGSGVYQSSQIEKVFHDLNVNAYGNAHSRNPSAELTEKRLNEARSLVLKMMNANEEEYSVIFTSGTTGSLKMVGEEFPWSSKSLYFYLRSNHNSVLGMREYATGKGGKFKAVTEAGVNNILKKRKMQKKLKNTNSNFFCLFAFPGKDNFAGSYYPLEWINDIQMYGLSDDCNWHVTLDAAAYLPTAQLDLSVHKPSFLALSFYKIFGYPTGLGALVYRNENAKFLKKVYWGGGSVVAVSCDKQWCKQNEDPSLRFEDGTVSFLAINCIRFGYEAIMSAGGFNTIHNHVKALSMYCYDEMEQLQHSNGFPLVELYTRMNEKPSGGMIAFNVLSPDGRYVHFVEVEHKAGKNNIHLRTGCFCNSGACQDYLKLTTTELIESSNNRGSCSDEFGAILYGRQRILGAIRISMGYLTTFADIDKFLLFLRDTFRK